MRSGTSAELDSRVLEKVVSVARREGKYLIGLAVYSHAEMAPVIRGVRIDLANISAHGSHVPCAELPALNVSYKRGVATVVETAKNIGSKIARQLLDDAAIEAMSRTDDAEDAIGAGSQVWVFVQQRCGAHEVRCIIPEAYIDYSVLHEQVQMHQEPVGEECIMNDLVCELFSVEPMPRGLIHINTQGLELAIEAVVHTMQQAGG